MKLPTKKNIKYKLQPISIPIAWRERLQQRIRPIPKKGRIKRYILLIFPQHICVQINYEEKQQQIIIIIITPNPHQSFGHHSMKMSNGESKIQYGFNNKHKKRSNLKTSHTE